MVRYDYPELVLDIHCGSGTYVRFAARQDIAIAPGTNAVMSELFSNGDRRISSAEGRLNSPDLSASSCEVAFSPFLTVAHLPQMLVDDAEVLRLIQGKPLYRRCRRLEETVAIDSSSRFIALRAQGRRQ